MRSFVLPKSSIDNEESSESKLHEYRLCLLPLDFLQLAEGFDTGRSITTNDGRPILYLDPSIESL